MNRRSRFLLALAMLSSQDASAQAPNRFRPRFSLEALTQVRTIGQWDLSADGTRIAYTLRGYFFGFAVVPRFGEDNNIFVVNVETGEIRKATSGRLPKSNPRFAPDGTRIAYEADGDIWTVDVRTGQTKRITVSPAMDRDAAWSPDGKRLVFVSSRSSRYGELGGPTDLWVTSTERLQERGSRVGLRRLTDDAIPERHPVWSPDGDTIAFSEPARGHLQASRIATVSALGGSKRPLTPDEASTSLRPTWSPASDRIGFLSDRGGFVHVWSVAPDGTGLREFDTGPYDSISPHFQVRPRWSRDGQRIMVAVNRRGRFDLDLLDARDGTVRTVARAGDDEGGHYHGLGWGPDDGIVYAWENAWSPPDLYVGDPEGGEGSARQLTFSSHAVFRREHMARIERVTTASSDGLRLEGYLMTPRGMRDGDLLPGIVNIHTNTYGQFYDHWMPFFHYIVESGYAMLLLDQRGSAGYGRAFRDAITGTYDEGVLGDIRAMATFLGEKSFVDSSRMASMGMSHGGYRTLFALTRDPSLFVAGVDVMGPTDRRTPYLNSIGGFHIGATEAEDPDIYERLSPITMVDRLKAPILIIHSNRDRNVPGAMTYNFVDELERHHKRYELALYPDEAHGLASPHHQLDAYRRIVNFLDRHLRH